MSQATHFPQVPRSNMISDEEHNCLVGLIKDTRVRILTVGVARLYKANGHSWNYFSTGLVTLTKDNTRKGYYLQLFNMDTPTRVWEEIVPKVFEYKPHEAQIHTFQLQNFCYLLSFASVDEGSTFSEFVLNLISQRKERKKQETVQSTTNIVQNTVPVSSMQSISSSKQNKQQKKKFSKADIGAPQNFRHVDHMGLNNCFFENPHDAALRRYLKDMNMESVLENKSEMKQVYKHIDEHGGIEKFVSEYEQVQKNERPAPPVPLNRPYNATPRATPAAPSPAVSHPQTVSSVPVAPPPPCAPPPPVGMVPPPPPAPIGKVPPSSTSSVTELHPARKDFLSEIPNFNKKNLKSSNESKPEPEISVNHSSAPGGSMLESLSKYLSERKDFMNVSDSDEDDDDEDECEFNDEWNDEN